MLKLKVKLNGTGLLHKIFNLKYDDYIRLFHFFLNNPQFESVHYIYC